MSRIGIVAALLGIWGGCAASKAPSAAPDGGGGDGAVGIATSCLGNTTCSANYPKSVYKCEQNHTPGLEVTTCKGDTLCSLGRCVSPSCAAGEAHASATGCLFYIAILDNVTSDDDRPTLIVVTNPGPGTATVTLQERSAGAPSAWSEAASIAIAAGSAASFTAVKPQVQASPPGYPPPDPPPARRVISDMPVTVMMVESDDDDNMASSSSGTMVLPAHALGTNYMTMSYQQVDTAKVGAVPGARGGAAEYSVVATQDRTTLWVYAPLLPDMVMPMPVTLAHDGDVFHFASSGDRDSLAGTVIASDQRVAVFSGNITTTYGLNASGLNSPDMAMEQMMPTGSWSRVYVAAHVPPQSPTCDSIFPDGVKSFWQIIASDAADITFYSASGQQIPGLPDGMTDHLGKGIVNSYWVASDQDFVVRGTKPILVTQGMDCEPTLASAVPGDAPSDVQVFALAPNFDHLLAIVRKNDITNSLTNSRRVRFDGSDITSLFSPVSPDPMDTTVSSLVTGFQVARVLVPPCLGGVDKCVHTLTGAWGMSFRGMDTSSSYSTTLPSWQQCLGECSPP